jgi:hypothetical protein
MDTIDRAARGVGGGRHLVATPDARAQSSQPGTESSAVLEERHVVVRWLKHDIPYIAMLALALSGVIFRLPVIYWVVLIPVFAVISIASGWRHFVARADRIDLVYRQGADWCALLLAIYLLFNSGIQGVLNANATSLAMMALLGLGTFVAGVQAKVWQISVVGASLFLAVPSLGWLDQSPMLLTAAAVMVVALCGLAWWASQRWKAPVRATASGAPTP